MAQPIGAFFAMRRRRRRAGEVRIHDFKERVLIMLALHITRAEARSHGSIDERNQLSRSLSGRWWLRRWGWQRRRED